MIFFKNTHLLFYLFIIFSSFQEIPKSEISIVWYGESTTQGAHVSKDKMELFYVEGVRFL